MYTDEFLVLQDIGMTIHEIGCLDLRNNKVLPTNSNSDCDEESFEEYWNYDGAVDDCIAQSKAEEDAIIAEQMLSEPMTQWVDIDGTIHDPNFDDLAWEYK